MSVTAHVLNQTVVSFQVIASSCKTHGCEGSVVYGLKASRYGLNPGSVVIDDISCARHDVDELIERLEKDGDIELDQLIYFVEDFLAELYSRMK
jgi:hypothetical protein